MMESVNKYVAGIVVMIVVAGLVYFFPSVAFIGFVLGWITIIPAALIYATYKYGLNRYVAVAVMVCTMIGLVYFSLSAAFITFILAWITIIPAALIYATYRIHHEKSRPV